MAETPILKKIKDCYHNDSTLFTRHAYEEMRHEEFSRIIEHEVGEAIESGEIIEEYPDDTPYPSVLINGKTISGRPIHLVCAYNEAEDSVVIVTVYQPDPTLWIDFKKRVRE